MPPWIAMLQGYKSKSTHSFECRCTGRYATDPPWLGALNLAMSTHIPTYSLPTHNLITDHSYTSMQWPSPLFVLDNRKTEPIASLFKRHWTQDYSYFNSGNLGSTLHLMSNDLLCCSGLIATSFWPPVYIGAIYFPGLSMLCKEHVPKLPPLAKV